MNAFEYARRQAERRQERLFSRLADALIAGERVEFVGVTGIGHPRSFYRLHWRIGRCMWVAAGERIQSVRNYMDPHPTMRWERATCGSSDPMKEVTFVEGGADAVAPYDCDPSKPALVRVLALLREHVARAG